jgi:signal peptidase I
VRSKLKAAAIFSVLALLVFTAVGRRVADSEMAVSIREGDWVWILPVAVRKGDVVALPNPLDPSKTVLRRAVAGPGETVLYDRNGAVKVGAKRIRQKEMGSEGDWKVVEENIWSKPPARSIIWRIVRKKMPILWEMKSGIEVPEGHWFLLADNRDGAVDSRWWGPLPESSFSGAVRLRLGPKDRWRGHAELMLPAQ